MTLVLLDVLVLRHMCDSIRMPCSQRCVLLDLWSNLLVSQSMTSTPSAMSITSIGNSVFLRGWDSLKRKSLVLGEGMTVVCNLQ